MGNFLVNRIRFHFDAVLNSYAQVLFSSNHGLAVVLILVTFIDPFTGFSGLLALLTTNVVAQILGFNPILIRDGTYGFNSLLVGLVLGSTYFFGGPYLLVLIASSVITLLITVSLSGILFKYGLPFLSLPFLFVVWIVILTGRTYGALELSDKGIYTLNEVYQLFGNWGLEIYEWMNHLPIPELAGVYFKSLGAIFLQYNLGSGIIISVALLLVSRISFTLSVLGFGAGYLFYELLDGDFTELHYSYIGFNFILSGIALGGFFNIPSKYSYLLVILSAPLIAILISASSAFLGIYQLPVYSLPFNIIVIMILYVLKLRTTPKGVKPVLVQTFSPELNLYAHLNHRQRFESKNFMAIQPPFYGEWRVSQGYEGKITHKGDWKQALDFDIIDDQGNTYSQLGDQVKHYYCYDRPILAPASGYVVKIENSIEDNEIGGVNLENNWGNTIIIKHSEFLFSKISHIKINSFKVKEGDLVKGGETLATCGNSGRSPEPHIHFQMQTTPYIGSKTIDYPIGYYILHEPKGYKFCEFQIPQENDIISKASPTKLLKEAFHFIPGKKLKFSFEKYGQPLPEQNWEVFVDVYNVCYLFCHTSKSKAWFVNNGTLFYFTSFEGDKSSLLFHFFQGCFKVSLGYYHNMTIEDHLPLYAGSNSLVLWAHDILTPFYSFLKFTYKVSYAFIDDSNFPKHIKLNSTIKKSEITRTKLSNYEISIMNNGIDQIKIQDDKGEIVARWKPVQL